MKSILMPLLVCLTLGLAPFTPEPHIVGKLKWFLGGASGMMPMDYFDLILHGFPFVWLIWALFKVFVKKN
ncbi:hypothetical protein [Arcticibacterium luteifluviistationis]|uniref:RND transporter n=1 Tax=Arcticibacterium luteifluviistationis TaxID=1784714 RepID=A0A2Z4GF27_9BACT|nr:hypothetical protein [Arcticibacterium luteifluviistationis]AWV99979.1 hypothetical protein DJ013_18130 [Arcticibacterium luteifluviistationis]